MNSFREKTIVLLLILIISIFIATSFQQKLSSKESLLTSEESFKSTRALQAIVAGKRIDINRASRYTLTKLPGVGPKFAERIIDYREQNNGFTSKEELLSIKGIGPKKYEAIKHRIEIDATR